MKIEQANKCDKVILNNLMNIIYLFKNYDIGNYYVKNKFYEFDYNFDSEKGTNTLSFILKEKEN